MRQRMWIALLAVIAQVGNGLAASESTPVDTQAAGPGQLTSAKGTLFARRTFGQPWKIVPAPGAVQAGDLMFGLPGATVETGKGAARLTFLADLDRNSPNPILEAAGALHDSPDGDLDFTLDRGRVAIRNIKKEGAIRVRIRFHGQKWEATLQEPGTRIALELYGRWAKGVPFTLEPGPKDVPAADLVFLVLHGHVDLIHGSEEHVLSAPPGPALVHWDNSDDLLARGELPPKHGQN